MKNRGSLPRSLTRRGVLRGFAGAAGGLLVGCGRGGCSGKAERGPLEARKADVVVVGAGLSGLMAARELVKAGVQNVLVLEARDRVGGLTLSQPIGEGAMVDGGGQWIAKAHTNMHALIQAFGLETLSDEARKGEPIFFVDGVRLTGYSKLYTKADIKDYRQVRQKIKAIADELPPGAPWEAPRAAEYDRVSMFTWLAENAETLFVKRTVTLGIDYTFNAPAEEISLLWFVATAKACGGLDALMPLAENENVTIVGGAQTLSIKMAEALGDKVLLSSPVERIVDRPGEPLRVETDKLSIETSRVIVAMRPSDTKRITFEPELPELRHDLVNGWHASPTYKAHIVYKTPFWKDVGASGNAVGIGTLVDFVFDATPPKDPRGVLVAFGSGEDLPSSKDGRREAVTRSLKDYFGDEALDTVDFIEMDWFSERWSTGCSSPLKPGFASKYGPALREPVRRVHWAGTDTSPVWNGFMEGAVQSGSRVAEEVVLVLKESGALTPPPAKSG